MFQRNKTPVVRYVLVWLAASLVILSCSAQTNRLDESLKPETLEQDQRSAPSLPASSQESQLSSSETADNATDTPGATTKPTKSAIGARPRSARIYNTQSGFDSSAQQQTQQAVDNYAAAYGGATIAQPTGSDGVSGESTLQANDGSSFASFGEQLSSQTGPNSGLRDLSSRLATSQLLANGVRQVDYSPAGNYYANLMSPSTSTSAINYHTSHHQSASAAVPNSHHQAYMSHYQKPGLPLGYPTNTYDGRNSPPATYYDRSGLGGPGYFAAAPSSVHSWSMGPSFGTTGSLMSSASSALSHFTGGFGLSEIVCVLIALSLGAIILGAPFFLIYLILMGNFSGSGTLSLTNPTAAGATSGTASTTVNGRKKRLAIFEQLIDSSINNSKSAGNVPRLELKTLASTAFEHLAPLLDSNQLKSSLKLLVDSIEKYSSMPKSQAHVKVQRA